MHKSYELYEYYILDGMVRQAYNKLWNEGELLLLRRAGSPSLTNRNGEIIMTQVLEAAMLICFGFSWPMNVYKNFKAKTAKSMSLPFILLIISGYIAGICAKIYSHNVSYVLVVYVLNLLIVAANVVIYFVNRSYDKKRADGRNVCL